MRMKPCVWSGYFRDMPFEDGVTLFKHAGFDHTEISTVCVVELINRGDPEKTGIQVAQWLKERDFHIPQGHLSFDKGICTPEAIENLKKELTLFSAMGVKNAVLHFNGGKELAPEARMEARLEGVRQLQAFIKGTDVYLCLENLGSVPETHTVEKLNGIVDALGGENLAICLDTGHLHLTNGRKETDQSHEAFITGAGKRLHALHVTENNGFNDVHQMPFSARYGINWVEVVKALKKNGYDGLFNLEILGEREAPLPIRWAKLDFIKTMVDYMLSDEFIK